MPPHSSEQMKQHGMHHRGCEDRDLNPKVRCCDEFTFEATLRRSEVSIITKVNTSQGRYEILHSARLATNEILP